MPGPQWEFRLDRWTVADGPVQEMRESFDAIGAEGWQLVTAVPWFTPGARESTLFIFQRPVVVPVKALRGEWRWPDGTIHDQPPPPTQVVGAHADPYGPVTDLPFE